MRKIDMAAGALFALFGAFVLTQSLPLNFYAEGVPGPGFFPALLSIALITTGGLLLISRLTWPADDYGDFTRPSRTQAQRSLGLWIAILVATLLVEVVGFFPAMLLLVAALLFGIERRRGLAAILAIVLTPTLAYLLFAELLQVRLPTGLFGD